jgi:hypothetical protein
MICERGYFERMERTAFSVPSLTNAEILINSDGCVTSLTKAQAMQSIVTSHRIALSLDNGSFNRLFLVRNGFCTTLYTADI